MTPAVEIFGEVPWGKGTLCSNLLLTAAHVIEQAMGSVVVNGDSFPLNGFKVNTVKKDALDNKLYEFAIFKSGITYNNYILSSSYPKVGQRICYHTLRNDELIVISGIVVEIVDYFIHCKFEEPIIEGECGSPILEGNTILGILNLGDGDRFSYDGYFQSSASIIDYLEKKHPDFLKAYDI